MFDRRYFEKPSFNYFPKGGKELKAAAFEEFQRLSETADPKELDAWMIKYLLDFTFEIDGAGDLAFRNTKNSAMKFRIMMQEIMLNALKYSSYIPRSDRFLRVSLRTNDETIDLTVENSMSPSNREKTTGNGRVIIAQFAKLLGAEPEVVKSPENKTYALKIPFVNFWRFNDRKYSVPEPDSLPMASDKKIEYDDKGE